MADPFNPEPKGAFTSFLDFLDLPGQVVRNTLKGRGGGALRNLADIPLNAIDAFLPGDWIPSIAGEEDKVSGADLVDIDKKAHPFLGFAADVGLGTLTDPLTYVPGALVAKGLAKGVGAARTGISAAPGGVKVLEGLDEFGRAVRSTAAAQKVEKGTRALVDKAHNLEAGVGAAGQKAIEGLLKGVPKNLREDAFRVINNYSRDAAGKAVPILDDAPLAATAQQVAQTGLRGVEEAGRQVDPLLAQEAYKRTKAPGAARDVGELESAVGIEGVSTKPYRPFLTDLEQDRIIPTWQNEKSREVLEQAFPPVPFEGRFTSGIELSNKGMHLEGVGAPRSMPGSRPLGPLDPAPRDPLARMPDMDPLTGQPFMPAAKAVEKPATAPFSTVEDNVARWNKRVDAMKLEPAYAAQLKEFLGKVGPLTQAQFREAVEDFPAFARPVGVDIAKESPRDYVQRSYSGLTHEGDLKLTGNPQTLNERTLKETEKLTDYLNNNPGVKIEEDIGHALLNRSGQQARMGRSSTVAKGLIEERAAAAQAKQVAEAAGGPAAELNAADHAALGARFKTLAEGSREAANTVIDDIAKTMPEDAQVFRDALNGLAPRGATTAALAKMNGFFKPYAVYGAFWPKFSGTMRNVLAGQWMVGSNKEARRSLGASFKAVPGVLSGAINDGIEKLFGVRLRPNEFAEVENAMKNSGGVLSRALPQIQNPTMRAAVENGVLDNNFVNAEKLLSANDATGLRGKLRTWMEWPGSLFQGSEQRMRYAVFKDLVETHGVPAQEAGRIASETFYSYRQASKENRLARDLVPFWQFTAKSVPQQAKLLQEKPWLAVGLSQAYGANRNGDPLYAHQTDKLTIPLGTNAQGDRIVASGLGLPFESLGSIPNPSANLADFGRQIERDVVGSAQPGVKSLFGLVSGEDPYFASDYGRYSKVGGVDLGEVGRGWNIATGAGLGAPIDQPIRSIGNLLDSRKGFGEKLVDNLTGANVQAVNPDLALQQQLQEALSTRPGVKRFVSLSADSGDEETQALIESLKAARKRVKDRRELTAP